MWHGQVNRFRQRKGIAGIRRDSQRKNDAVSCSSPTAMHTKNEDNEDNRSLADTRRQVCQARRVQQALSCGPKAAFVPASSPSIGSRGAPDPTPRVLAFCWIFGQHTMTRSSQDVRRHFSAAESLEAAAPTTLAHAR